MGARPAALAGAPAGRCGEALSWLRAHGDPARLEGMARYGIATTHAYGVTVAELRVLARELGRDHALASELWESDVHEARILASMIDDPALVDAGQMEHWAAGFDSWDLCDQVCANLFRHTPLAYAKAAEWSARHEPLVKRAGFALIAGLTVVDKDAPDARFASLLSIIAREADGDSNLVCKGASWALRQIGKRNLHLNTLAIQTALGLRSRPGRGARWVGADALRELRSEPVQRRVAPAWVRRLPADPLPALLAAGDTALEWSVRHDLLDEPGDANVLWQLPEVSARLRRQRADGSWPYRGGARTLRSATDYAQLATYEVLLELVAKQRLDVRHPAIARAARFMLGFQTAAGDLRGIYGTQYTPNYTAAILAVLLDAKVPPDDARIAAGMHWLLSMRQHDGGWAIPLRTQRSPTGSSFERAMSLSEPVEPDRSRPASHLVTGIVLRALAAHPGYRDGPEARAAAGLLASRLFKPDAYPDRRSAAYWEKLRFPFRWTDIAAALDAMLIVGVDVDEPPIGRALAWLSAGQDEGGLWRSAYAKAADPLVHQWTSFGVARVIRRATARDARS
jgi:3-methyladenine DNA glycosylase AlkD